VPSVGVRTSVGKIEEPVKQSGLHPGTDRTEDLIQRVDSEPTQSKHPQRKPGRKCMALGYGGRNPNRWAECLPYLLRHVLCRFLKTRSADSASGFRPPNVLVLLQFESQPKSSDEIG
jgi:hypothetical protein